MPYITTPDGLEYPLLTVEPDGGFKWYFFLMKVGDHVTFPDHTPAARKALKAAQQQTCWKRVETDRPFRLRYEHHSQLDPFRPASNAARAQVTITRVE